MIILRKSADLKKHLTTFKAEGGNYGFVPTMGALHLGHLSLIANAKAVYPVVVCSIFINPTQFNDPKDFEKYPVTIEQDILLLEKAGCTILFLPDVADIYPEGLQLPKHFELGDLETILDGKYRPGHFQGVCQVVYRLLNLVQPNCLYLGQKDFQQCLVLKKMCSHYFPALQIMVCATERAPTGLALSSRNSRLSADQQVKAVAIYTALQYIHNNIRPGSLHNLKQAAIKDLTDAGFKVDYVEIASMADLQLLQQWNGQLNLVILIAAFLGEVRLIDNLFRYAEPTPLI